MFLERGASRACTLTLYAQAAVAYAADAAALSVCVLAGVGGALLLACIVLFAVWRQRKQQRQQAQQQQATNKANDASCRYARAWYNVQGLTVSATLHLRMGCGGIRPSPPSRYP